MKPRRPLFPFDVCWSHVSNLAHILGHSSLKSRNHRSMIIFAKSPPASFEIARKVDELLTNGKSFSPIGGYGLIVDYGGDHALGDSFGVGLHKTLTWQYKLEDSDISQLADEQNVLSS